MLLTTNLRKARRVVSWLAAQEWPDGKALGKSLQEKVASNKVIAKKHIWQWQGRRWVCSLCGQRSSSRRHNKCEGAIVLDKVHVSHKLSSATIREVGTTVIFCVQCGVCKTASSSGLVKSCMDMAHTDTVKRLKKVGQSRHPYNNQPMQVHGPIHRTCGRSGPEGHIHTCVTSSGCTGHTTRAMRAVPEWSESPEW